MGSNSHDIKRIAGYAKIIKLSSNHKRRTQNAERGTRNAKPFKLFKLFKLQPHGRKNKTQ